MRCVNFDHARARFQRSARGRREVLDDTCYILHARSAWDDPSRFERHGTGCINRLPTPVLDRKRAPAFPRPRRARFEAGVRELNTGEATLFVDERNDFSKLAYVTIEIDAQVLRADATFGRDCGSFGKHESRAADGAASQMHQMPSVCIAVDAGILAHRRDGDTVAQRDATNCARLEQIHRLSNA